MPETYKVTLNLDREAFLELSAAIKTRNSITKAHHSTRAALDALMQQFEEWKANHRHPAF